MDDSLLLPLLATHLAPSTSVFAFLPSHTGSALKALRTNQESPGQLHTLGMRAEDVGPTQLQGKQVSQHNT